jgi:NAD(P)-dependent dehydrogenase (short-subunit alcohol dehydrogenase family)
MMTYRASPAEGVAWITGASSGIGRGAALELARRGYRVYATARRRAELEALSAEAIGLKGSIVAATGDVTDRSQMAELVAGIELDRPIALALLNAGGNIWDAPGDIGGDGFAKTMALNLQGVVNGLNPVFSAMGERRRGQIAIVASVAGYCGLPNSGAYGPSKAAVISLAEGMKFAADPLNVTIQVVNPGYVKTPLTAKNDFPMPFLMECDEACRRLCDGLERGGFEIRFPMRLALLMRLFSALPYPVYFPLVRAVTRGR